MRLRALMIGLCVAMLAPLAAAQTWLPTGTLGGANTWSGANTFTGTVTIDTLRINDTADNNYLSLILNENLTADRTLNLIVSNASRTLTISGDSSLNQALLTSSTPTFAGLTDTGNLTVAGTTAISTTSATALQVLTGGSAVYFTVDTSTPNVGITQLSDANIRWLSLTPFNYTTANADPNEPAMRRFNMTLNQAATGTGTLGRKNQVLSLGYNNSSGDIPENLADVSFVDRWETYWNPTGTDVWLERHVGAMGLRDGVGFIRPIAIEYMWTANGDKRRDETPTTQIELQADIINLNSANTSGSGTNRFSMTAAGAFTFSATGVFFNNTSAAQKFKADCANGAFLVYDSAYLTKQTNNQAWLYQVNSTGTNKSLAYLDSSNVWQFGAAATTINLSVATQAASTLGVTGVATFTAQPVMSSLTASQAVFTDGSKGLVSNAITGTGNVVMSASPTLTGTITAAAATLSGEAKFNGTIKAISTGGAPICGTATLPATSPNNVTVSTTAVTASSLIFITPRAAPAGRLSVTTITAGTSFVINDTNTTDGMAVSWMIVEPG